MRAQKSLILNFSSLQFGCFDNNESATLESKLSSECEDIDSVFESVKNSGKIDCQVPDPDFRGRESCLATCLSTLNGDNNMLPTICMEMRINGMKRSVRVLLDCAATASFVSSELVNELRIPKLRQHDLKVDTVHGRSQNITFNEVNLTLFSAIKNVVHSLPVAAYVAGLDISVPKLELHRKTRKWKPFTFTEHYPRMHASKIDIILGGQLFHSIFCGFQYDLRVDDYLPFRTHFGDGIVVVKDGVDVFRSCFTTSVSTVEDNWDLLLHQFFEMTTNDIVEKEESPTSVEVMETNKHFENTIRYDAREGRYVTSVAFRSNIKDLEPNYNRAYARLVRTEQTLRDFTKETGIDHVKLYSDAMNELIGPIIELDEDQTNNSGCFLAHRAVFKLDKANAMKTRIVFDASMKGRNKLSLNETIKTYENVIPNLREILLHQRFSKYLLLTDIRKFFLSVLCNESQRKFYRLLWRENASSPPKIYRFRTHIFGDVSAPARSVKALLFHLKKFRNTHPVVVEQLEKSLYMDDANLHCDEEEELLSRYLTAKYILKLGGFQLGKTVTNSEFVNSSMKPEEKAEFKNFYDQEELSGITTLGLGWVTGLDAYTITNGQEIYEMAKNLPCTRRNIMRVSGKLFDACGFIEPLRVLSKMLLQQTWLQKTNWDEELDDSMQAKWKSWIKSLPLLKDFLIPRYIQVEADSDLSIEAFSDASIHAAACAVYLRVSGLEKADSYLLYSGSSVKICNESIPRKEINAALMGAQKAVEYARFLDIPLERCHLFTDSFVVVSWIRRAEKESPSVFRVFVANRLEKILKLIPASNVHYISTSQNPSDIPSRGMGIKDLLSPRNKSLWLEGPMLLKSQEPNFRFQPELDMRKGQVDTETAEYAKEVKNPITAVVCATALIGFQSDLIIMPLKASDFSNANRLKKVSYFIFKFIAKIMGSPLNTPKRYDCKVNNLILSIAIRREIAKYHASKYQELEVLLHKMIEFGYVREDQVREYGEDFQRLQIGNELSHDSKLQSLSPYYCTEFRVLRLRTRLVQQSKTDLFDHNEFYAQPVLMPKKGDYTKVYCVTKHEDLFHFGHNFVYHKVRETFFIPAGKFLIRNLIAHCTLCSRYHAKRLSQKMADLPRERVSFPNLFKFTFLDHSGPFYVREKLHSKEISKCYLLVITCASTRMTHIALCDDFTSATFMMTLEEFFNKWRVPAMIFSDQHPSYKPVADCLNKIFSAWTQEEKSEIFRNVQSKGCQWRFNCVNAPWKISIVERLNAILKKSLYMSIGRARVTKKFFSHLLSRIEDTINRRPFMEVSPNVNDARILCPKSFIFGDVPQSMPCSDFELELDNRSDVKQELLRTFQDRCNAFERFVECWKYQYLDRLLSREKWVCQKKPLPVGSVVLIAKEKTRSIFFPMGIVMHHHVNPDDGLVREYTVKTSNGKLKRFPCQDLCRLEVDQDQELSRQEKSSENDPSSSNKEDLKSHSHAISKKSLKEKKSIASGSLPGAASNIHPMQTRSKRKDL